MKLFLFLCTKKYCTYSQQIMRIEGAPRYHISTLLQTPPAFLVLSSHALCALGRFLICFQGNRLYLWFFFFALVCCSLYACRLRFALNCFSSTIFNDFWQEVNYFQFFVPPCGFKLKKQLRLIFYWLKKCTLLFRNIPLSQNTNQKL